MICPHCRFDNYAGEEVCERCLHDLTQVDTESRPKNALHRSIIEDPVSRLDLPAHAVCNPSDQVADVVELMKSRRQGCVVVEEKNRPVGIFTERDLMMKVIGRVSVSDAPSADVSDIGRVSVSDAPSADVSDIGRVSVSDAPSADVSDIGRGVDQMRAPIKTLMTSPVESVKSSDSIAYVLNKMSIGGFRHIPIADDQGRLTAVVSVRNILQYLARQIR